MSLQQKTAPDWNRLFETAAAQDGYFSTRQAADAGYSTHLLIHHIRSGKVERARRGVYRLVHFPTGEYASLVVPWLWSDRAGVLSHQTALSLHQLSDVLPARIHLTLPEAWRHRRLRVPRGVVPHYADIPDTERAWFGPVPITSPRRSLNDVAKARLSPEQLRHAAGQAIRRGLVAESEIQDVAAALEPFGGLASRPTGVSPAGGSVASPMPRGEPSSPIPVTLVGLHDGFELVDRVRKRYQMYVRSAAELWALVLGYAIAAGSSFTLVEFHGFRDFVSKRLDDGNPRLSWTDRIAKHAGGRLYEVPLFLSLLDEYRGTTHRVVAEAVLTPKQRRYDVDRRSAFVNEESALKPPHQLKLVDVENVGLRVFFCDAAGEKYYEQGPGSIDDVIKWAKDCFRLRRADWTVFDE